MASYRRVAGYLLWWGCLLGVLPLSHSAERINVPLPSVQDLLNRANPVLVENALGYVQAHDSAFQYQQRSYSAPIQQKTIIPTPAIKDALKGAIKGAARQQAAAVIATAAVSAAVAGVGWVIDQAGQPVKKIPGGTVANDGSDETYYWYTGYDNKKYPTMDDACNAYMKSKSGTSTVLSEKTVDSVFCLVKDGSNSVASTYINRSGSKCPVDTTYNSDDGGCYAPSTTALVDADYDALNSYIDTQGAEMRASLAKAACNGSLAPERCYAALQSAASFLHTGPSSIQGPKSTSTTTNKNSDGTVSTETTNRDTKFDMKYDGTGATATPTTKTTKTDGKGGESVSTEKEDDDSNSGTATVKEDEKETPAPCLANCDGPAYKDLYTKTDVTKESVLDTYASKVKSLPIMSAVGNFFTISAGGTCPVWSTSVDLGAGQSVTLSNDFACQPWFTALGPACHAVLMLLGGWLAFRVSILD